MRCALDKCYQRAGLGLALSYGTRKLIILLFGSGFLASRGSFWCFCSGGLRRFAKVCGWIFTVRYGSAVRASIIRNSGNTVPRSREWIHGTVRYGTSCDGGRPTGSNIAPRQPTLKSDSSGTITSVMYALGTTFSAIRKFSIIPI